MEKNRENENTKYLTAIRGFACLIVIVAHILAGIPFTGRYVSGCGKIGVWLFFILSAFLLTRQWMAKEKMTSRDVIQFYVKRFFRIFPCYFVTLFIAFAIGHVKSLSSLVKHLFLLEGIGHFWTIPVEFVFYLIVPLLAFVLLKIKEEKKSVIFLLILGGISEILFPYWKCSENSIQLRWYFPVFIMGMITAFVYQRFENQEKNSVKFDVIIVVMVLLMLCATPYFRKVIFGLEPDSYLQNKFLYFGVAWSIVILAIQNSQYIIHFLNCSRFLQCMGNISFPLYLIHFVVLDHLKLQNVLVNSFAIFGISCALAVAMHQWIEQPMIKVARKINNKFLRRKENGKI